MLIRRAEKLAIIHLARKDRGLDEEAYRALLGGAAGIASAAQIKTEDQYMQIMQAFRILGFIRKPSTRKSLPLHAEQIGSFVSERQLYYIKGLWELASRAKDESSLTAMLKRIGHVDDLRFLSRKAGSAMILALRDICWKAGFNPDGPERPKGVESAERRRS